MATFKPIISYKRADGTYLVQIRVIHNRRKKVLSTPIYITDKDLTRGGKIKNLAVNEQLEAIIAKMRTRCNEYGIALKELTVEQVVELITTERPEDWHLDFIEYCNTYINRLKEKNHTGNAITFEIALSNFTKFLKRDKLDIKDLNKQLVLSWARYMESNIKSGYMYLGKLKTIFNSAKAEFNNEDEGLVRIPQSPFNGVILAEKTAKRKSLTDDELARLFAYKGDRQRSTDTFARNMFCLSLYTMGTNLADLYECGPAVDGYIIYERKKTRERRKDRSEIHIKIIPEAQAIIDMYADPTGQRLLNFYRHYLDIKSVQNTIQQGMSILRERLNIPGLVYYSARHTWATIATNKCGIDIYTVHKALNHVLKDFIITDVYIDRDFGPINQANRIVADYCATIMQQLPPACNEKSSTQQQEKQPKQLKIDIIE